MTARDLTVEVLPELGGRSHRILTRGHDLPWTPATVEQPTSNAWYWASIIMVPWCNHVPDAVTHSREGSIALPRSVDAGSAIDDEVRTRPWARTPDGAWHIRGTFGFTWRYLVRATVGLDHNIFSYPLAVRTDDTRSMPAGPGWHPWFDADDGTLTVHASAALSDNLDDHDRAIAAPHPVRPHTVQPLHRLHTTRRNRRPPYQSYGTPGAALLAPAADCRGPELHRGRRSPAHLRRPPARDCRRGTPTHATDRHLPEPRAASAPRRDLPARRRTQRHLYLDVHDDGALRA